MNIEAERVRRQMTKDKVAAELGITTRTYSHYVKGDTPIPSDILISMATMFHCSIDYLLGFSHENTA